MEILLIIMFAPLALTIGFILLQFFGATFVAIASIGEDIPEIRQETKAWLYKWFIYGMTGLCVLLLATLVYQPGL